MIGRLRLKASIVLMLLASACAKNEPTPDLERAASYRDGSIALKEVEAFLRREQDPAAPRNDLAKLGSDELIARYRRAAESILIERVLTAGLDPPAVIAELGPKGGGIRRQVDLTLYLGPRLGKLEAGPADIEKFYAEHRESFRRAAARQLWHIFRRHRDPDRPQETLDFLSDLKKKAESGSGFNQLAQEFSDSETRVLGGRLGLVQSGRLPKKLEEKVFALGAGTISEPIPVPGGAALFYVSEVINAAEFSLDDVKPTISAKLFEERRRARVVELVGDRQAGPGSTVLELHQLAEALAGKDQEKTVLAIGDFKLSAAELKKRLEQEHEAETFSFITPVERLQQRYRDLVHEQLLLIAAAEETPTPAQEKARDERVAFLARLALVDQKLEARMKERAGGDQEALRRFYDDNRHTYQSQLRLKLKSLTLPVGPRAPQDLALLEKARAELVAGRIDFEAAADRVSGDVFDLGWVDFPTLMTYEAKLRYYLLDLNGPGFTVPFQINRRLGLFWVEAREEPQVQPFEAVQERLISDFFQRNQQTLFRATVDALLAEARFHFEAENVRRSLAAPAPAAVDAPG